MIGDRRCGLYLPGHQVHYIQARKAAADAGVAVEVLGLRGDALVLSVGDGVRLYRNHHPQRVLVLARDHGKARLIERYSVLRVGGGNTRAVFSLARIDTPVRNCPMPPDV